MNDMNATWEKRLDDLWKKIDDFDPDDFVVRIDTLSAELPPAILYAQAA
jgi:hypothetical protein